MKKLVYISCIGALVLSCTDKHKVDNRFQDYINKIPDLELPFSANSYQDLQSKVEIAKYTYDIKPNGNIIEIK